VTRNKAGRTSKPTAKKRAKDEGSGDEGPEADGDGAKPRKRIKLFKNGIVLNQDGGMTTPIHPPGDGYDSEMEGAEEDPVIEEQLIFRMMEGEHLDYLRRMIDERKIGVGADFELRWLSDRRGYVRIQGQMFATVLVDLPTIIESMKTWDRKAMVKSADICQMLLAFARVKNEQEARTIELPKVIGNDYRWPHGLTPPMHDSIHRRFRKRLSHKEIQNKEKEVDRLLKEDNDAKQTKWEWVDERRTTTAAWSPQSQGDEVYSEDEQDAEGEMDDTGYFPAQANGGHDKDEIGDDVLAQMEAELDDDDEEAPEATPMTANAATPPGMSDDYDDEDGDEAVDPDDKERRNEEKGIRDELEELDKDIANAEGLLQNQRNPILRQRMLAKVNNLKEMRRLKARSVGITLDDDED
jgi:transcription initiation factor TFIID subunit 7